MTEEYLEFRMNSNLWKLPFLLAIPIGLLSFSFFGALFVTWETNFAITAYALLFMVFAYIYSGFRKKTNSKILITRHALHFGSQSFYFKEIKRIELSDPKKIILRFYIGTTEYQTIIKLSDVSYEQQEKFLEALREINGKLEKRQNLKN